MLGPVLRGIIPFLTKEIFGALHPPEQKWEPHSWVPVTQRCLSPVPRPVLMQMPGISPSFELSPWISALCHGQRCQSWWAAWFDSDYLLGKCTEVLGSCRDRQ